MKSIEPGNLTFTVKAGSGYIVDDDDDAPPSHPVFVVWPRTVITIPQTTRHILIDSSGVVRTQNSMPTPEQRRKNIVKSINKL